MPTKPAIFKWRQSEPALILCAVRWYLRYSLSLRNVEELLEERGLGADHTTVWRWVQRYAPEMDKRLRCYLKPTNKSWRVDETYIRVKGPSRCPPPVRSRNLQHCLPPIVGPSNDPANDALAGPGNCGTPAPDAYLDRCGYGTRLPFLVISPFAKSNNVDSTTTDLTSVLRFIEDNWGLGRIGDQSLDAIAGPILNHFDFDFPRNSRLVLDPSTGEPVGPIFPALHQ
jgi:hypothetical protein